MKVDTLDDSTGFQLGARKEMHFPVLIHLDFPVLVHLNFPVPVHLNFPVLPELLCSTWYDPEVDRAAEEHAAR